MTIEAVFFDAGETLLHPQPSLPERTLAVLHERGHAVSSDDIRNAWWYAGQHFVNAADEGFIFAASTADSHLFWTTVYLDMLDHLGIDDPQAADVLFDTFTDPANYALFDDAVPTLHAVRDRGLKVGIISNFEGWLSELLERLDVTALFEVVAISGDLGFEKPDPQIFRWAMEQAGVGPDRSLHVGDSPNFDAQPAHALGMTGVLLDRHGRWTDLDAPYPKVTSLEELLPLLS